MRRVFHTTRSRAELDVVDLVVGLLLAVGLPFLGYFVMQLVGAYGPAAEPTVAVEESPPPPDRQEVEERLKYCRQLYRENAAVFIERARREDEVQQFKEINWAITALKGVRKELSALEYLITSTGSASRFASQLDEVALLKARVDEGLRQAAELDHLGIYSDRR